ncbi:MAG TPA: divalent-cation tolerance protein CutA [Chloroflexi bacterium]|jgi:uncharacterized protein involved in tolerance to divalent cations|nr:divalent-cation tolerance protein CutA [Chloroflexota bacterium]
MSDYCVVLVTVATAEEGQTIAGALVDERLAACASIVGPVRSLFRWQGSVQDEAEHLLIIKTEVAALDRLTVHVRSLHRYDLPEIIALPIVGGSQAYLNWIGAEVEA